MKKFEEFSVEELEEREEFAAVGDQGSCEDKCTTTINIPIGK